MNVIMPPQWAPGAPQSIRDRLIVWFPHTLRWARNRVRATIPRLRLRQPAGQAESGWSAGSGDTPAWPADAWPADGAGPAYDPGVAPLAHPILAEPLEQEAPGWVPAEPRGRPGRRQVQFILVVAAEPGWSQAIAQQLAARNYLVLTAGSVREASEELIIEPALLILDAGLPDASGWDLLDWLARCGREVPVVIIAARERGVPRRVRVRPLLVLPPPVALETLVAIVQEHLLAPQTAYGA